MAKDPATVRKFLTELGTKLGPLWQEEQGVMLRMKEDEAKELGFDFDGKLDFWDFRSKQLKEVKSMTVKI